MTGITFAQMRHVLVTEAERIDIVQIDLIGAGIRKIRDPGQMHMKAVFEAIARLIDMIEGDETIKQRLREKARDARNAAQAAKAET